jgi:uncharacterized protein (UPF0332 family)
MIEEFAKQAYIFLSGSAFAALLNFYFTSRANKWQKEAEHIREQLSSVYGPLFYLTSQIMLLAELTDKVYKAFEACFGKCFIEALETEEPFTKEMHSTKSLANAYMGRSLELNNRVMEVLEKNWHMLDTDDLPILSRFQVNCMRLQVEIKEGKGNDTPSGIYESMGKIHYMPEEVSDTIKRKFFGKMARLQQPT